jgi:prepilin-type N-terminal cleavage/methylation domain-containing protein
MSAVHKSEKQAGFTLIEIMVSVAIFLVIAGSIFSLLGVSQKRFQTESQVLGSFQEARLGLDQIVRDVNDAGYPPQNHFSTTTTTLDKYANSPIGWSPAYPGAPCQIGTAGGGTCTTPSDFDVIFEGDVDGTGVKWIRYQLTGTTLFRGVAAKTAGADPATATSGVLVPYVMNVINNDTAANIVKYRAAYPAMFPGGNPQPVFQYTCDNLTGGSPILCQNALANNSPVNIRDVEITLIVRTPQVDAQTGRPKLVELNGRGHRLNPNT